MSDAEVAEKKRGRPSKVDKEVSLHFTFEKKKEIIIMPILHPKGN